MQYQENNETPEWFGVLAEWAENPGSLQNSGNSTIGEVDASLPGNQQYLPRRYEGDTWFSVSNNLIWNSTEIEFTDERLREIPGVTDNNNHLVTDPEFVEPAAGDYRLKPTSPAIDAGTQITEYQWFQSVHYDCFRGNCRGAPDEPWIWAVPGAPPYPQPDPSESPQPLDGNLDGVVEFDIGAKEYVP